MANNKFVFDGMDEFKLMLRNLPAALTGEALHIVEAAANGAAFEIRSAYGEHRQTGNLQDHVTVSSQEAGRFGASMVVKSTARHAFLFENGTQARHTDLGYNRGAMPPGHVFIPIAIRKRRAMYEQLMAMLEREGFLTMGTA